MENKINIADILKDVPKGINLYSPLCGICYFDRLNQGTIICKKQNTQEITFTSEGYYMLPVFEDCECVLFPSKENRDWRKFQIPFKDGDIVFSGVNLISIFKCIKEGHSGSLHSYVSVADAVFKIDKDCWTLENIRFATEEEKQKLFQAIKDNGYKWNEETKTLEKLVEPKFHEGEWLCVNKPNDYAHLVKIIKVVEVFGKKRYTISRDYDSDLDVVECDFIEKNYHLWTIEDAKDGDVLFHSDSASNGIFIFKEILQHGTIQKVTCYCDYDSEDGFCLGENHTCCWTDSKILHPATKEQCALLFRMMKKAGYEWNKETKTLEKLIKPKFKVGDRITSKVLVSGINTITKVCEDHYELDDGCTLKIDYQDKWELINKPKFKVGDRIKMIKTNMNGIITNISDDGSYKVEYQGGGVSYVHPAYQDEWELVPNKFDISTLKAFDKVLVRLTKDGVWNATFFSHYDKEVKWGCYPFVTTSSKSYSMCIPYEGNEHLLGTNNDCDEYFKTW